MQGENFALFLKEVIQKRFVVVKVAAQITLIKIQNLEALECEILQGGITYMFWTWNPKSPYRMIRLHLTLKASFASFFWSSYLFHESSSKFMFTPLYFMVM